MHQPQLLPQAKELASYLQTLSRAELSKVMHISETLAQKTHGVLTGWNTEPAQQTIAMDSFVGDIYSGLRASTLSQADRNYADTTLRILSGLYGILRPYDGIRPYRLEMGYKLPAKQYRNLYAYWGERIAQTLPADGLIVNASSVEYSSTVLPFVDAGRVITPRFLTMDAKTNQPAFVVVHAKIARGAFARWLIQHRAEKLPDMLAFDDIGYKYDKSLSTPDSPAFVCEAFGGIGLSMRLA